MTYLATQKPMKVLLNMEICIHE